jgi:ribose/xylose/arabinose/galactoside ABC-type transport system permease subunit
MAKALFWVTCGAGIVLVAPLLGVLGGAFSGWIVSMFFDQSIHATLAAFGLKTDQLPIWQIGATLGFVGGFFRPVNGGGKRA